KPLDSARDRAAAPCLDPIRPRPPAVPEEIVHDGRFDRDDRCHKIVHAGHIRQQPQTPELGDPAGETHRAEHQPPHRAPGRGRHRHWAAPPSGCGTGSARYRARTLRSVEISKVIAIVAIATTPPTSNSWNSRPMIST